MHRDQVVAATTAMFSAFGESSTAVALAPLMLTACAVAHIRPPASTAMPDAPSGTCNRFGPGLNGCFGV